MAKNGTALPISMCDTIIEHSITAAQLLNGVKLLKPLIWSCEVDTWGALSSFLVAGKVAHRRRLPGRSLPLVAQSQGKLQSPHRHF